MRLLIFIFCLFLLSCSATKRANKHLDKAFKADSATVADRTRTVYPCIVTQSDTTVLITDSLIYIDCPETLPTDYLTIHDTLHRFLYKNKVVKVPVKLPVKTVYITNKIEDSTKIKLLILQENELVKKIYKLEKKVGNRNTWLKILSGLLIAAALVIVGLIKFKR